MGSAVYGRVWSGIILRCQVRAEGQPGHGLGEGSRATRGLERQMRLGRGGGRRELWRAGHQAVDATYCQELPRRNRQAATEKNVQQSRRATERRRPGLAEEGYSRGGRLRDPVVANEWVGLRVSMLEGELGP